MALTVIGINGSPYSDGTTAKVLEKILSVARRHGGKTEMINLAGKKINPCMGCYSKNPKGCKYPCVQKDDMQKIYPLLLKADALVFGTPVYWFNMSGLMKNFIDRLTCTALGGYLLDGKIGVFIAVSKENEGGRVNATLAMASAMNHLGLLIPPYGLLFRPGKERIVRKGRIVMEDWTKQEESRIAKNIVELGKFLKKAKFRW